MTPEQKARVNIDALRVQAGWLVCNVADANILASVGVAIRESSLNNGFGCADDLPYGNRNANGEIEAMKEGATLTGAKMPRAPLMFEPLKELVDALNAPPPNIDEGALWQAYAALPKHKVKGASQRRLLTDWVSLVRFAMQQTNERVPYPERVQATFKAWLAQHQQAHATPFTLEKQHWLEKIRDRIAANLGIEIDDFEYAPFHTDGGLGKVHQLFGAELPKVSEDLNRELAA